MRIFQFVELICISRKSRYLVPVFEFSLSVSRNIPDVRSIKVRYAYRSKELRYCVLYNVVYLNTPETTRVSHLVYRVFLYGLFMSHAHNPPPRAVDSRPPFQSPGSVRMFCIARRSIAGFSSQWR